MRNREESTIQQHCVRWFRYQHPTLLLISVPNGAFLSGDSKQRAKQWYRLESEGAIPGAADLALLTPRGGHGCLLIEMKTRDGRQSPEQKDFEDLAERNRCQYRIARSVEEFIEAVTEYLALPCA